MKEEEIKDTLLILEDTDISRIELAENVDLRTYQLAVNNLLSLYQEQKQLNEIHQKINGELRVKVKELEKKVEELENQMGKDLDVVYLKAIYDERDKWKDKIKEKIKKLETRRENEKGYKGLEYSRTGLLNAGIQVLQELLGE